MRGPWRLVLLIVLFPIWFPFWMIVMGVGIMTGQPMMWASLMMHFKYRTRSEPEVVLPTAPQIEMVATSIASNPPSPATTPDANPQTGTMIDVQLMAKILLIIGAVVLGVAVFWFLQFVSVLGIQSGSILPCLALWNGYCDIIYSRAARMVLIPFHPTFFWLGILLLAIGGVVKVSTVRR